jgi:multidrug efflux system membrane fusion protein
MRWPRILSFRRRPRAEGEAAPGPLAWVERNAVRAVLLALAAALLFYEFSAMLFAYSADAYVTTDVVEVAPEVPGPIARLHVRDNDPVAGGAALLEIEQKPFFIAFSQARAAFQLAQQQRMLATQAVAESDSDVAARQATLTDAEAVVARIAPLARDEFETQQRLDDANRDLAVARAQMARSQTVALVARRQVQVAEAQVEVAQAEVDRAAYNLERTRLVAPGAGRVVQFEARVGDYIPVGRAVLAVALSDNWRVVANVTERHLPRIRPGQTVLVMLGSDSWRIHRGRVRSIGAAVARSPAPAGVLPYIEPQTDWVRLPRRFPVEIDIPGLATRVPAFRGGNAWVMVLY